MRSCEQETILLRIHAAWLINKHMDAMAGLTWSTSLNSDMTFTDVSDLTDFTDFIGEVLGLEIVELHAVLRILIEHG